MIPMERKSVIPEIIPPHLLPSPAYDIIDPQEKKMRQLDKLIDELAKAKPTEEVLR